MDLLVHIWPHIERAPLKGTLDAGDYVNVPFPVEAKNCKKPLFLEWVRKLRPKAADHRWVLVYRGDMRTADGHPLMVVDMRFGLELLLLWERHHKTNGRRHVEVEGREALWPVA